MTTPTEAANVVHAIRTTKGLACGTRAVLTTLFTDLRASVSCPACLAAMGEPAETIHAAGPGPAATYCGLPFTADLRLSANRRRVTCPACLTGMGEPRVVSGLDTAAATPEPACTCVPYRGRDTHDGGCPQLTWSKHRLPEYPPPPPARPSRVEVGQRWRDQVGEFTVEALLEPNFWHVQGQFAGWGWPGGRILKCEYLGTVPAPVSAPAGEAAPALDTRDGPYCIGCHQHVEKCDEDAECETCPGRATRTAAGAPGQSIPVETPPTTERPYLCEAWCGKTDWAPGWEDRIRWCSPACKGAWIDAAPKADPDHGGTKIERSKEWWMARADAEGDSPVTAGPAAPAPGVGEGARELTFAEAVRQHRQSPGTVQACWAEGIWYDWNPVTHLPLSVAAEMSERAYRLRPEPLPAPAPRVSRVRGLTEEWINDGNTALVDRDVDMRRFAALVVEATLQSVGTEFEKDPHESMATHLDRARAAMLEPPACPGRRP